MANKHEFSAKYPQFFDSPDRTREKPEKKAEKRLISPKSFGISPEEYDKIIKEEMAKFLIKTPKMRSDEFFLQKRTEKIKEKIIVKNCEISPEKLQKDDNSDKNTEKSDENIEKSDKNFEKTKEDDDFSEEIKGIEVNKVMANWLNKGKTAMKSLRIEPILKKKEQELFGEELEKKALKKIEEKIKEYLKGNNEENVIKIEKNTKNMIKNDETLIQIEKIDVKNKKNLIKKPQKKAEETAKKTDKIVKKVQKKPNFMDNIAKTPILDSPEARNPLNTDKKHSKTPNYHQQLHHRDIVLRARTPESKIENKAKYFVSINKLNSEKNSAKKPKINEEISEKTSQNFNEEKSRKISQNFNEENCVITDEKSNNNGENWLDNYTNEKFIRISHIFEDSIHEITVKSLQTLRNFITNNPNLLMILEAFFGLLAGFIEEIPLDFIVKKEKELREIQRIMASPWGLVQGLKEWTKGVEENTIKEANILFALDILNKIPSLDSFENHSLISETLKKLHSIIEKACEFYKIYHQNKIHASIDKQRNGENRDKNFEITEKNCNEKLNNCNEKPDNFNEKPDNFNEKYDKKQAVLEQQDTFQAIEETSKNLVDLISEFERKEHENATKIKKKLVNQAKFNEEKLNEKRICDKNEKNVLKKHDKNAENRLNKIMKISLKKPEVESIIKLYLNKSGEFKEGKELMTSQRIVEEDIRKAKKNVQELSQKNNRIAWQEEREIRKFEKEEERKRIKQEIERQYNLERKFQEYISQKEKKEKEGEKASKREMHQTMKDKKELENLKEQIKIKEEYMKTLEEGQWKDHKKKLSEIEKKINNVEKNPLIALKPSKILQDFEEKNKQSLQDYKNNLMNSALSYQELINQKELLEKALKNSALSLNRKLPE